MTLEEIRNSTKEMLTPADIAPVLGCDPQDIRTTAKVAPHMLGFPVCVIGSRTKVPKAGFLNWLEGKT